MDNVIQSRLVSFKSYEPCTQAKVDAAKTISTQERMGTTR